MPKKLMEHFEFLHFANDEDNRVIEWSRSKKKKKPNRTGKKNEEINFALNMFAHPGNKWLRVYESARSLLTY